MRSPWFPLAFAIACGGQTAPAPTVPSPVTPARVGGDSPAPVPKVGLVLAITPVDAEVVIDDVSHGVASALPTVVPLESGVHQLVVTRDGYKPYRVEFIVSDKLEEFTVTLERARR